VASEYDDLLRPATRSKRKSCTTSKELAGWETEKMVRRCAHLAAEHLMAYAGNMEVTAQIRHNHRISAAQPDCK